MTDPAKITNFLTGGTTPPPTTSAAPAGATGPQQTITAKFVPSPVAPGAKPVTPPSQAKIASFLGNTPMTKPIDSYGIDLNSQRDFLAASSDEERTLVLEKGKKLGLWQGYGNQPIIPGRPDAGLEWFVIQNGKKVAVINPFGSMKTATAAMWSKPFENMLMGLSAFLPEDLIFPSLGRAAAGAVKTGALEGKGIVAVAQHMMKRFGPATVYALMRSAITGTMAMAGAELDRVNKQLAGVWAEAGDDLKHTMLASFLTGSASEFVSRLMSGVFGAPRAGYAPLLPAEHKQTVKSAIDRGFKLGIYGATKGKSWLGTMEQSLIEYVFNFGKPLGEKANLEAMKTEAKNQLMATGMTASHADTMIQATLDSVRSRFDRTGVNQDLRDRAKDIINRLQLGVDADRTVLESDLNARLANLERMLSSPDPATQELAQQQLIKARQKFGEDASGLYAKVDTIIAGSDRPVVVDMGAAKKKGREIWNQLPRDQFGNIVFKEKPELGGFLVDLMNMSEFVSFKDAQRIRKALYDAGEYKNLTGNLNSKLFNELGDVIDKAFETADFSGVQPYAVKALRDADNYWRENIPRFQGLRVDQLMSGRVLLEPEEVANIIFKRGMTPEAERFKSLMTPEGWANVGRAFFSKLAGENKDVLGNIDPLPFLRAVQRNMNLLKVAFGDRQAGEILKFAQDNAAFHGKIPAAELDPGNFRTKLEAWQARDAALQEKLKGNYIHMLMDQSTDGREAISYMLDDPRRIADAKAFFGEASPQWTQIKGHAMTEILARSLSPADDPTEVLFEHGRLSGALARFSDAELTELFGASHAADLKQLAKDIDLAQTRPSKGARATGAFAAATLILAPFHHIPQLMKLGVTGLLLSNQAFVRWFATGFEEKTAQHLAEYIKIGKMLIFMSVPGVQKLMNLQPGPDQNRTVQ